MVYMVPLVRSQWTIIHLTMSTANSTPKQGILQAALTAGSSATAGLFHSNKPTPVDPAFDGSSMLLADSFTPELSTRVHLKGKDGGIHVPLINWGTWPWGDSSTWQHTDDHMPGIRAAWKAAVDSGLAFFDLAEIYGSGSNESIVGDLVKTTPREKFQIATKWFPSPTPANLTKEAPLKHLRQELERLNVSQVDLYIVHGPIHLQSIKTVANGFAEIVNQGLAKCIGVANYSESEMIEMYDILAEQNIPLASNQVEYSILRRHPETSGLIAAARQRGIQMFGYSSLAQGRLSGKYSAENEPPKSRKFSNYPMKDIEPTLDVLRQVASTHGVTPSAAALNYCMIKGVIPLVGVRSAEQVEENAKALGWRLSKDEVAKIDSVSMEGKTTYMWQRG